jgi:signal transduction histidine kinase
VQELVSDLAMVGEIDPSEGMAQLDLVDVMRSAARSLAPQIERGGVEVRTRHLPDVPDLSVPIRMSPRAATLVARALLGQAVAATPRGSAVTVTISAAGTESPDLGPRLTIDDCGASLPSSARRAFVALELEPSTFGRPSSIPLFVSSELVAWQGAVLELADAPEGGLRVALRFRRV